MTPVMEPARSGSPRRDGFQLSAAACNVGGFIVPLFGHFLALATQRFRRAPPTISRAVEARLFDGDVRATLAIPRKTFYDEITRHGIDLDSFRK